MPRLRSITVPERLQRNAPEVLAQGVEETGKSLLKTVVRRIGHADLSGLDLLDIGCGVRFTQTLINRDLPFSSYTGIEVFRPIVDWLKEHVEKHDDRFRFVHWDVQNARYNPEAAPMTGHDTLPVSGKYHLIMGFSLLTHLDPQDALHLFRLARKTTNPDGFLFFSAFCDDSVDEFEDRVPAKPLLQAYYNKNYLEKLIDEAGWTMMSYEKPGTYIMDSFLCRQAKV
jgi:SAM-dependent methyltransferase